MQSAAVSSQQSAVSSETKAGMTDCIVHELNQPEKKNEVMKNYPFLDYYRPFKHSV
jgi:hypothetical protein